VRVNYCIVFVSDMKRSVAFYRDVVGMPLRFESPGWTEFATEGSTIALHLTHEAEPARNKPGAEPAGHARPGLRVASVDEFHAKMLSAKVPCVQEPKDMFGARIAQYADPDGLVFSVSEDRRS
jgi:lactoylglutathione lyase